MEDYIFAQAGRATSEAEGEEVEAQIKAIEEVEPIATEPVFSPEKYLIERAGDAGIWLAFFILIARTLDLKTFFRNWANLPDRIEKIARGVESTAENLNKAILRSESNSDRMKDTVDRIERDLSVASDDLKEIKEKIKG